MRSAIRPARRPQSSRNTRSRSSFAASLFRLIHQPTQSFQLLTTQSRRLGIQQRRHHLLCRSAEKGVEEVTKRRTTRLLARNYRTEDITDAVLCMPDDAL